jgi:hypothetical protein
MSFDGNPCSSVLQTFQVFAARADLEYPQHGTAAKENARESREWIQVPANE